MKITAQMVKELRDKTGAGMMDCKKALTETEGDMEAALDALRKKGLAAAKKKAGRITSEGKVAGWITDDGKNAGLVEVNCETDFVARGDEFTGFVNTLCNHIQANDPADIAALNEQKWVEDANLSVADLLTEKISKIGENISVRQFAKWELQDKGMFYLYIHGEGTMGVLVEVGCGKDETVGNEKFQTFAKQVAMQIGALAPLSVSSDEISDEIIEREKAIYIDQVKEEGKPEKIWDKIVEGKLQKFFQDMVLLNQEWVHEMEKKKPRVNKVLEGLAKELGDEITVRRFIRWRLGEGLEKRSNDLAAEVAEQLEGK